MPEPSIRDGYGPVSGDDVTTLQDTSTENDVQMFGSKSLKEASGSVNPMAAPSGRTSMSTMRTSRAVEHFDGNPNIPPYECIEEDPDRTPDGKLRRGAGWPHLVDAWNEWWVGEVMAALLSLGCLAIVIWILVDIGTDGTKLSDWTLSISPNSMVSTFITASRFLILYVVAECLGQLRWLYFQGGARPLDELEVFDSASRGALGSMLLVLRLKARALIATWAALTIIVALAMDPFAQQILSFPSRTVALPQGDNIAWMPATQTYNSDDSILYSSSMRKAIYGGFLGFETEIDFGCLTGNCTWDAFSSLGVCSTCEDVSNTITPTCSGSSDDANANNTCSELTYTLADYNLTLILQNGSLIDSQEASHGIHGGARTTIKDKQYTLIKSVVGPSHPGGLQDPRMFEFVMAQLLVGSTANLSWDTQDLQNPSWNITACAVSWCAKVYENVEVQNGALINGQPYDVNLTASPNSTCWTTSTCQEFAATNTSGSSLPAADANATFAIAIDSDSISVRHILDFDYNITVHNDSDSSHSAVDDAYTLATTMMWNTDIAASFRHIAASMTSHIRTLGSTTTDSATNGSSSHILGTATHTVTFVVVSWPWFALPAAVVASGIALLVICIVLTARGKREGVVWKSASLPLLLLGLPAGRAWREEEWRRGRGRGRIGVKMAGVRGRLRADERGVVRFVGA